MRRGLLLIALTASLTGPALAQAPMGDSAKSVLGDWEFSNADRDKICVVTFKADPAKIGYKVEFDKNCPQLFPLVSDVASWNFPENDFLLLLNAQGKALVQFSESERAMKRRPRVSACCSCRRPATPHRRPSRRVNWQETGPSCVATAR